MSRQPERVNKECLSPGAVMALLDDQLGPEEKAATQAHLKTCSRCQQLAADLKAAAGETAVGLRCLDDEAIAAWVDHQAGRVRGRVGRAEMRRRREHLSQCRRCRERAAMLAEVCAARRGLFGWLRGLLAGARILGAPRTSPGLRWAAVAVVAVAVTICLYLAGPPRRTQPGPAPSRRQVVSRPPAPTPRPQPPATGSRLAPDEHPAVAGRRPGPAPPRKEVAGAPERGPRRGPEAALVPGEESGRSAIAGASAALAQARRRGDASAEATAALELGGLYHEQGDYQSAARYYREASAAAEKAGKSQVQVDALILEGAALAELGDEGHARQRLELALGLAREAGYDDGEQNALVQLELLEGQPGGRGT